VSLTIRDYCSTGKVTSAGTSGMAISFISAFSTSCASADTTGTASSFYSGFTSPSSFTISLSF